VTDDAFTEFAHAPAQCFRLPERVQHAIDAALQDARWDLVQQLREIERALAARPEAVVLSAPSSRCQVEYRSSYQDDLAFVVQRGGVRVSMVFYRREEFSRYTGAKYHGPSVWAGTEYRRDVFGNEWHRDLHGYFLMDDFGDLVEAPTC